MKYRSKISKLFAAVIGIAALALALFCLASRAGGGLLSARPLSVMSDSAGVQTRGQKPSETPTEQTVSDSRTQTSDSGEEQTEQDTQTSAEATTYPVIESHIGAGALTYSNFSVKNTTDFEIDFEKLLSQELPFEVKDTHEVQVLVVHTHTCESYLEEDTGYYAADYYPRTADNSKNVTRVGDSIVRVLKAEGIGAVQCTVQHDNPSYEGSYGRSMQSIQSYLERYPNIKVILDIHRDSLGYGGADGKIKPTFTYDGKKGAQIMIMSGYDPDGSYDYPDWEKNLSFALKLQQTAEEMYPGITRPLYFGNFVYNLNANTGSLLIEVGTDVNTLDEAVYSGELIGKALARVLQK